MRSLGFDLPNDVLLDEYAVHADIYTEIPGGDDEWGDPQPPSRTYYVKDAPSDVQPKSGGQRAAESGTSYESTHVLYLHATESWPGALAAPAERGLPAATGWPARGSAAALIEAFFERLAGEIPIGAQVETRKSHGTPIGKYTVVYIANWGTHLEIDLKAV